MITDETLLRFVAAGWLDADDPEFGDRIDTLLNIRPVRQRPTLTVIKGGR